MYGVCFLTCRNFVLRKCFWTFLNSFQVDLRMLPPTQRERERERERFVIHSVLGGTLIIFGLYCVTWGKMKTEGPHYRRNTDANGHDPFVDQERYLRNYLHLTSPILPFLRVKTDKL